MPAIAELLPALKLFLPLVSAGGRSAAGRQDPGHKCIQNLNFTGDHAGPGGWVGNKFGPTPGGIELNHFVLRAYLPRNNPGWRPHFA